MGRGRQKAKATKVARKLKYFSPQTDYAALERELVSASSSAEADTEVDEIDYEELASKYNVDDEDDWDEPPTPPAHGAHRARARPDSSPRSH